MKKLLFSVLSGILLIPYALFAMGAPGTLLPEDTSLYQEALSGTISSNPLDRGKELLAKISPYCPSTTGLALGGLAVAGCVAAYKTAQARDLARELAIREGIARAEAEHLKQLALDRKLNAVNKEFNPLITSEGFKETYNGLGFNGWFNAQQQYIVKLIESEASRTLALNKEGLLATTDPYRYFGYTPVLRGHVQDYFYLFTVDTPTSAKLAWQAKQAQPGPSEPTTSGPVAPLQGDALEEATAQLNPPLILTLKKITRRTGAVETYDNLRFQLGDPHSDNPYTITIYEDTSEQVSKPGWFARWFSRRPETGITVSPVSPSVLEQTAALAPSPLPEQGEELEPTQPTASGISIRNTAAETAPAKSWWQFWK